MTASISRRQLIAEGRRLHMAIVEWGKKHGVWAYVVMSSPGQAYFEIFDPKAKTISYDFPARIKEAIETHKVELAEYSAWECGDLPAGSGSSCRVATPAPSGRNRDDCDCNAHARSQSPIKTAECVVAGDGGRQTDPAAGGGEKRGEVDFTV